MMPSGKLELYVPITCSCWMCFRTKKYYKFHAKPEGTKFILREDACNWLLDFIMPQMEYYSYVLRDYYTVEEIISYLDMYDKHGSPLPNDGFVEFRNICALKKLLSLLKNYEQPEPLDHNGMEALYDVLLDYKVLILEMDFNYKPEYRRDCNIIVDRVHHGGHQAMV